MTENFKASNYFLSEKFLRMPFNAGEKKPVFTRLFPNQYVSSHGVRPGPQRPYR